MGSCTLRLKMANLKPKVVNLPYTGGKRSKVVPHWTVFWNRRCSIGRFYGFFAVLSACLSWANAEQREVWIAPGAVHGGRGTEAQPWIVSAAKTFDHLVSRQPEATIINLQAGVFPTYGTNGFRLKSGQRMIGAGVGRTVLRLVAPPPGAVLASMIGSEGDNTEDIVVQDLTLDCNYQSAWGRITVQAIGLAGTFQTIRRVECVNAAGFAQECFAIGIFASTRDSVGNLIEGCKLSSYQGGWCTGIAIVNNSTLQNSESPVAFFTRGVIRNNNVVLQGTPGGNNNQCAYGAGGTRAALFVGNSSSNATYGFNFDTCRLSNVTLQGNTFTDCTYIGINARANRPGDSISGLALTDNAISLNPSKGEAACYGIIVGGGDNSPASAITITGNTISVDDQNHPTINAVGIMIFTASSGVVAENIISQRFHNVVPPSSDEWTVTLDPTEGAESHPAGIK